MKISKSFKTYIHTLIVIFFIGNVKAVTNLNKNIIFHDNPKPIENLKFKDFNLQDVDLSENKGKIMILNFWATWCAPCKKEMPSLSRLAKDMPELKIFAINMEKPNQTKAKKFKMRGLPTTILIDKNGNEFARIIGEIDFDTKDFKKIIKKNS